MSQYRVIKTMHEIGIMRVKLKIGIARNTYLLFFNLAMTVSKNTRKRYL